VQSCTSSAMAKDGRSSYCCPKTTRLAGDIADKAGASVKSPFQIRAYRRSRRARAELLVLPFEGFVKRLLDPGPAIRWPAREQAAFTH